VPEGVRCVLFCMLETVEGQGSGDGGSGGGDVLYAAPYAEGRGGSVLFAGGAGWGKLCSCF
jgi:hypothetical protein